MQRSYKVSNFPNIVVYANILIKINVAVNDYNTRG